MGETNTEVKPQVSADVFTKQQLAESKRYKKPVSYTHLTLPTILRV
jgi:hypothetical protein